MYLIDPVNGGYRIIYTSYPRLDSKYSWLRAIDWSYDSKKIAVVMSRMTVRNWSGQPDYERSQSILSIYDIQTGKLEDILAYDEDQDRKNILTASQSMRFRDISFSPDNRSILLTVADIISADDKVYQPDVYRLDLPDRLISPVASQNVEPPVGGGEKIPVIAYNDKTTQIATSEDSSAAEQAEQSEEEKKLHITDTDFLTTTIKPMHMTVEETAASLSSEYGNYFTTNPARNVILFKGPENILKSLRSDLEMIDTPSPHILVDMLAIELSDEANRRLGLDWTYAEGYFALFQPGGSTVQKYPHIDTDEDYRAGFPSGALDSLNTIPGVGQTFYRGVGRLPREFYIRLNALIQNGKGTILANPRTVAMSGKESLIQIRKTLNYFFNEGFDVSGRPVVKKSDITADTEGRITSILLSDGRIDLKVDVKVGNFTFTSDAGLPELTTRQSTTEVDVHNGETLILGGLRQ